MSETIDVGFLGLGQMGSPIAERLLGKSLRLHVHDPAASVMDRFVAAGATAHDSPRSVADAAGIVFACLPSPQVSLDAALGPRGVVHGSAMRVYIEMSTIGKETVERIAQGLSPKGVAMVDGPVTGGPPVARAGNLTIMVSGAPEARAAVDRLLALMGKNVLCMGDRVGMAQTMKIVNNLVMSANLVAACEGMAMGVKAGLDPGTMLRVMNEGTSRSFAGSEILPRAVYGRFDFGAALSIVDKDTALGMREAEALGLAIPVIGEARKAWDAAQRAGLGHEDFTTIIKLVETRNGVVVRSKG